MHYFETEKSAGLARVLFELALICARTSALACLEAGIFLVDNEYATFAADDPAAFFTQFGGFQRISDFHRITS